MSVIGVIPARAASTRLPGKMLRDLGGEPLVVRTWRQASKATSLDRLIVATDDEAIRRAVEAAGGEAVMTRPDHPSGTDRIFEAVQGLDETVQGLDTIVINIQGDEPFIDPALIDRLAAAVAQPGWDMATAAVPIGLAEDLLAPSVVKVVADAAGRALYFSRSPIPHVRDGGPGPVAGLHWRHLGIYAYRFGALARFVAALPSPAEEAEKLEQLRALHLGLAIRVLETESASPGIDTEEDLRRAEAMVRGGGQ